MPVRDVSLLWPVAFDRLEELERLAKPLLDSPAVQRLARLTFLGILSPRFCSQVNSPLWNCDSLFHDGNRFDHSVGVALAALELAHRLGLSPTAARYAVAWGLTHDIATWPLSHTGETAFRSIARTSPQEVRAGFLLGSDVVPVLYRLPNVLRQMGVQPEVLLTLFDKEVVPVNAELGMIHQVIHSPMTPDTLEGSWRAGVVFSVPVPSPADVLPSIVRANGKVCLHHQMVDVVVEFWNRKAEVYNRFINRPDVILWESAWTLAIKRLCANWSLAVSLEANEDWLVNDILQVGLPDCSHVIRYKQPQEYQISGDIELLRADPAIDELWQVLGRRPLEVPHHV